MPKFPLTVAVAQPLTLAHDLTHNIAAHVECIRSSRSRLVVFPELSLTGYELDAEPVGFELLHPIAEACRDTGSLALLGAPIDGPYIAFISPTQVLYRKSHLGGDEARRFRAGPGPVAFELDGWRIGLGICKDTGVAQHLEATAALGIDLYVAGLVHHSHELEEQDARALRMAKLADCYIAFASFAGPTGGGFVSTAGHSAIYSRQGAILARAGARPQCAALCSLPGGN
jgi:predicted amidohydrolase